MKHTICLVLCAWVIWTKAIGAPDTEWSPDSGVPTYEECVQYVLAARAEDQKQGEDKKWMWRCFPSETDPRPRGR